MKHQLRKDFQRFLETGAYCTPPGKTQCAFNNARTLAEWREAESSGLVRIQAEPEQESFASVYGRDVEKREWDTIERFGVWHVYTEVNHGNETENDWQFADGIGMCVYSDPTDPFETMSFARPFDTPNRTKNTQTRYCMVMITKQIAINAKYRQECSMKLETSNAIEALASETRQWHITLTEQEMLEVLGLFADYIVKCGCPIQNTGLVFIALLKDNNPATAEMRETALDKFPKFFAEIIKEYRKQDQNKQEEQTTTE